MKPKYEWAISVLADEIERLEMYEERATLSPENKQRYCIQRDDILAAIDVLQRQGWISVKDRLPEKPGRGKYEHVYCLVYSPNRVGITILPWNCEHLCWDDSDGDDISRWHKFITHWMPLPEAPDVL